MKKSRGVRSGEPGGQKMDCLLQSRNHVMEFLTAVLLKQDSA